MNISSCDELRAEFMKKYSSDFEITGGGLMKTFLGMEVEQDDTGIKLHLDHYIQTVLSEYTEYIKKSLRPKKVPISPGVILHPDQVPAVPDKLKQKYYRSFVAKLQFAATWIRMDISFTILFRSLLDSVHRQGQLNGRPSTTLWNIWKATLASRSHIGEAMVRRICCRGTQIRTGAIAHLDNRRPA